MQNENEDLRGLLEENLKIAKANHALLEKLHRASLFGMAFRILWYAVLIGLPLVLYYLVLEPYMRALGFDGEQFKVSVKNFSEFLRSASFGQFMQ